MYEVIRISEIVTNCPETKINHSSQHLDNTLVRLFNILPKDPQWLHSLTMLSPTDIMTTLLHTICAYRSRGINWSKSQAKMSKNITISQKKLHLEIKTGEKIKQIL